LTVLSSLTIPNTAPLDDGSTSISPQAVSSGSIIAVIVLAAVLILLIVIARKWRGRLTKPAKSTDFE
jgi:hypothetical protein